MSGMMELDWEGRRITIERKTKGRIPMGDFRAFETDTGIPVPELNGSNCGQMLLGVEKSVFLRSGFLRQSDLPVTQDEALRRRLNALVTTADESDSGELLAQKLKELKNRCRFNRGGLLPQAESQRRELEEKLTQLQELQVQAQRIRQRQAQLDTRILTLENHKNALEYARYLTADQRIREIQNDLARLNARLQAQEKACEDLPDRETARRKLEQFQHLADLAESNRLESQMLPQPPEPPKCHPAFSGRSPGEVKAGIRQDLEMLAALKKEPKRQSPLPLVGCGILAALGAGLLMYAGALPGSLSLAAALVLLVLWIVLRSKAVKAAGVRAERRNALLAKYAPLAPESWLDAACAYEVALTKYRQEYQNYTQSRGDLDDRLVSLRQQVQELTAGENPTHFREKWTGILGQLEELDDLRRARLQLQERLQLLEGNGKLVAPPAFADTLTCTVEETAAFLTEAAREQKQLQLQLGQTLGQMEALGDREPLLEELGRIKSRITALEEIYGAVTLAQETLARASQELQRRFAPRITQRTRELFARLTGGRYDRLVLEADMNLSISAQGEAVLRSDLWRSDGTVDQLYLALRLAVAEALIPQAPLFLDDALVRFDDSRLAFAMEVLREEAQKRQILLFSCQSREKKELRKSENMI